MIHRELTEQLKEAARYFPVVVVLGPRQSGKTTLVQKVFEKHAYVSLEDLDSRFIAQIVEEAEYTVPIEIKAGKTVTSDFFKQFDYWRALAPKTTAQHLVIYGGSENRSLTDAKVLSWQSAGGLIRALGELTAQKSSPIMS
jgi:hypothetical protein